MGKTIEKVTCCSASDGVEPRKKIAIEKYKDYLPAHEKSK
jgi:hypothetical protein